MRQRTSIILFLVSVAFWAGWLFNDLTRPEAVPLEVVIPRELVSGVPDLKHDHPLADGLVGHWLPCEGPVCLVITELNQRKECLW